MRVSLRALALILCLAAAVAIGVLTLSVSVTKAVSSLHDMGDRYTLALADVLRWKLEHFFEVPSVSMDITKNASRVNHDGPVGAALQTRRYLDQCMLHQFLMPDSCGVNFLFYDGSRIFSSLLGNYSKYRFTDGVQLSVEHYFRPEGFSAERWFYDRELNRVPPTHPFYSIPVQRIAMANYLEQMRVGTLNGSVTGWLPQPLITVVQQRKESFDLLIGPIYSPSRKLLGFGGPYIYTQQMSRFLDDANLSPGIDAFVIDNMNGCLFSSTYRAPFESWTLVPVNTVPGRGCTLAQASTFADVDQVNTFNTSNITYMYCRLPATDYAFAPLQALMGDRSFALAEAPLTAYITVDGDHYFAASTPIFVRYPNVYLQLVVVMTEAVVVGALPTDIGIAVGVGTVVIVLFGVGVVLVVALLLQPVVDIAERMGRQDPMRSQTETDEGGGRDLSMLAEVRNVQLAHRAMRSELERIRGFVPSNAQQTQRTDDTFNEDDIDLQSSRRGGFAYSQRSALSARFTEDGTSSLSPRAASMTREERLRRRVRFSIDEEGGAAALLRHVDNHMMTRDVAVMAANVNGFHQVCNRLAQDAAMGRGAAITEVVRALVRQARSATMLSGGAIECFNGDQIVASFNANVFRGSEWKISNPSDRALTICRAALNAAFALIHGTQPPPSDQAGHEVYTATPALEAIHWRVGVAYGSAVVGLAGTETAKAPHIIGSAWGHAVMLEQLSKVHGVRAVLVSDRFLAAANIDLLRSSTEWRVLGGHVLPGAVNSRPSAIIAVRRRRDLLPPVGVESSQGAEYERALKMHAAERMLRVEGRDQDAAAVSRTLTELLGGEANREDWELREALRWSDLCALQGQTCIHCEYNS